MINFVNIKINPVQSFRGAHRGRVCVRVFLGVSVHEYLCLYCISQKKLHMLMQNNPKNSTLCFNLRCHNISCNNTKFINTRTTEMHNS
jgi:hypothetical protein